MDRFLVILVNGYLSQAELKIILSKAMIKFKIIENNEIFVIDSCDDWTYFCPGRKWY